MAAVGLLFACFGPAYAGLLLRLLYGERWGEATEAPAALAWYCGYVLLLALNGVTEAFVHAVADAATLARFNRALVGCSATYLLASSALLQYGVRGMIVANGANMLLRIAFSARYIAAWRWEEGGGEEGGRRPRLALPAPVLAAFGTAWLVTLGAEATLYASGACDDGLLSARCAVRAGAHVGVGVAMLGVVGAALWRHERALLVEVRRLWRLKRGKSE